MHIKVMIVDDEPIAAKATAFMIKRGFPEFEVSGIFHSGREAVKYAAELRPDIVIMDIEMPGINGLEAMRQIQSHIPTVKFIIISAYSNFHYAVDAMFIGASDYLLKPVRQKEFTASIEKIAADILIRKEQMEQALEQQERMELLLPILIKDFIHSFLPKSNKDERLIACASFLDYLSSTGCVLIAEWNRDLSSETYHNFAYQLQNEVQCEVTPTKDNQAAAYIVGDDLNDKTSYSWLETILNRFKGQGLVVGIGNFYQGAMQMKQSCKEAYLALEVLRKQQAEAGSYLHIEEAVKSPHFDIKDVYSFEAVDTPSEAQRIVDKANSYMEEFYAQDIALEEVASLVNLSPFYFSRFYKETSGMNFSDKLLEIRMERAKEFLKIKDISIKDAAYMTGYKDPNYFSKVFKRETGITAREYRSIHQSLQK